MKKRISPYMAIPLSFLFIIIVGTILLSLPISTFSNKRISILDSFFLATSSVSITGLSPVANISETLTIFGKVVLMGLIQVGGLSVIVISVFFMSLIGAKIGITNRILIKESLNQNHLSGIVKLVKKIIKYTFIIEFIGIALNLVVFIPIYGYKEGLFISIFHAISSFNNAGFDLFGSTGVQEFAGNILFNISTTLMIMFGGLGFIVIEDLIKKKRFKKLTINSKIIMLISIILWIAGTIFIKITSGNSISLMQSFFMSISSRTAGFAIIDMTTLKTTTLIIVSILMFIGAAPASTGGGIKVTTFFTLYKSLTSYFRGKKTLAYKRYISEESRYKAFILFTSAVLITLFGTVILVGSENLDLEKAMFEVISAFSNTGFTIDLTPKLGSISKITLSIIMFLGRSGVLTTLMIFNKDWHKKASNVEYIEEKILIG